MPSYLSFVFSRVKVLKILSDWSWSNPIPLSDTMIPVCVLSIAAVIVIVQGVSDFENFRELLMRL